jgi:hypothetical protein
MAKLEQFEDSPVAIAMYEAAVAARGKQGPRNYLGMSQLGAKCARALWYQFRQFTPKPAEGRVQMIFEMGDAVEAIIIRHLLGAGHQIHGISHEVGRLLGIEADGQIGFKAHNDFCGGHCDGIIEGVTQRRHILECKSAKDAKWKLIRQGGIKKVYPIYWCQGQLYMGYAGLERILWVVMNKDTCEIYTERGHFDLQAFEALNNRAREIIAANTAPAKLSNNADSFDCTWCDYRLLCHHPEHHIQIWATCGSCQHCSFTELTPVCYLSADGRGETIPREYWGKPCGVWAYRANVEVPF